MLDKQLVEAEAERLRDEVQRLPDPIRFVFHRETNKELKDPDTYAVLAWSLPLCLHHFYLGKWNRGLLELAAVILGLVFFIAGISADEMILLAIGIPLILAVSVAELYCLFRSEVIVKNYNNKLMVQILENARLHS
ncbi:MAG: hypothetical protein CMI30_13625 [Opitutae bacterium]|nr:hypothetical protein [Opitutae bacterium]|tara:strand:+ start:8640 stop:9047 length:408 start_codon:yes stop_codon:yes gene_type:complete